MTSQAQREAGNYRMQHIRMHGLAISIETPKGQRRRPEWPPMAAHYGYIKGTCGRDGDHLDVFIGPNRSSELVYVVDQSGASGKRFDEHKIMLGFDSEAHAVAAYRACYTPEWTVGPVTAMTIGQFKNWIRSGDHMKPLAKQVSRYSVEISDLYLAPERITDLYEVDRYEWQESAHPRHQAGAPNSVGGQFAPTGESQTGSQGIEGVAPYKPYQPAGQPIDLAALQDSIFAGNKPQSSAPLKSTRKREVAALPDTIKEGHALHLSALSTRDRADLLDWSRRLNEAMAKVQGPNEEAEWRKVDKNYIRAMLEEMNKRDSAARGRGVRFSDYINANGLIPEALAARLDGGKRFFDPEHIRDRIKAGNPTPEAAKAFAEAEQKRRSTIEAFKHGSRATRKAMVSSESDVRHIIMRAMGLNPDLSGKGSGDPQTGSIAVRATGPIRQPWEKPITPKRRAKPPELASKPPEPTPKPPEQDSLHTAVNSAFEQLSKPHQKKVDEAIRGGDEDMPSDTIADLRNEVLTTWKQMSDSAQEHNMAIRQVMSQFTKHWGLVSAQLAKGVDTSKIPAFDEMTDYARAHFPQILSRVRSESDTGSDEESLAAALKEGLRTVPNPWDDSVIQATQQRVGSAMATAGGDYPAYPSDPDDPDYVPFSVRSLVAEIMRYWNAPEAVEKFCA